MTALPVTSVFVGIAAIALALLGLFVAVTRLRMRVRFGDNGEKILLRRIRTHGNFVEYVPLALVCLALIEYRLSHAIGILSGVIPFRSVGISLTFLMLTASGIVVLRQVF
jgi:uncharacterized membrane protein YecN with MAPEG domain